MDYHLHPETISPLFTDLSLTTDVLRLCSAIVHFILNNSLYFVCCGWSAQTSPKRWFGKHKH